MDRSRYVELAPLYYALAIVTALRNKSLGKVIELPDDSPDEDKDLP